MPSKILVIKLGAFGDLVLAFDAFHAIRSHHRDASITLLTRKAYASWARQMPWFDEVWEDPSLRWWEWRRTLQWRRQLRAAGFTRVYDLQGNDRTAFYFRILGRPKPEWSGPVPGCSHPRPDFRGPALPVHERLLRQLEAAGVPRAGRAPLEWLTGPVDQFRLPPRYVVLVPGCSPHRPQKRWPAQNYAQLARRLFETGLEVLLVGTSADRDATERIKHEEPRVRDLTGQTDFGQLAELARRATAVVGNDTGPIHLMAAVGAPTLVLYSGESDPRRMLPPGPHVAWLQRPSLTELTLDDVWTWFRDHWLGPAQ
ncbi:MAG: glycosyl transferase [Limisphaera sp.]|nr:MAG: glycosyl transferase [Limisphaera sp.]